VRGVRKAVSALVLAPGATASRDQSALVAIDDALAPEGMRVERIDFPYRLAGRRAPDRQPVLVASVVAAARKLADDLAVPQARIALGLDFGGSNMKVLVTKSRGGSFCPTSRDRGDQATRERQAEVSTPRAARISAWKGLGRVTT
jgi:predicted alpha/beta-hydrolase family hydrolase